MTLIESKALASAIYIDLHSSAGENFQSSLLAAAFNECDNFRKVVLNKWAGFHGNLDRSPFWATANDLLPRCLRGPRKAAHLYERPDIVLWDQRKQEDWDALEGYTNTQSAIAEGLHTLFIELKWDYVSPSDYEKLVGFLNRINKWRFMKFALVVSLEEKAVDRIRHEPRWEHEKPLHKLFNNGDVRVITHEAVAQALQSSIKNVPKTVTFPATSFARDYFSILTRPESRALWTHLLGCYLDREESQREIRDVILDSIFRIGLQVGYLPTYPKVKLAREANLLSFTDDRRAQLRLSSSTDDTAVLNVKLPEQRERVRFRIVSGNANHFHDGLSTIRTVLQSLTE